MKILNYKLLLACLISVCTLFSSCQKDEVKDEEENGFQIETECSIDGVDVPVTKAENNQGWTTGDGIYHKNDNVTLTANAKSGYELVTFYNKADVSKSNLGSPLNFKAQVSATYKAEFRSTAPTTYCIYCSITGQGSVSGTGCGKTNGTYTLTANPSPGWSSNWTTKQVTVNGADVNTSVVFTKKPIQKTGIQFSCSNTNSNITSGIIYVYIDGTRYSFDIFSSITVELPNGYYSLSADARVTYRSSPTSLTDISATVTPGTINVTGSIEHADITLMY